VLALLLVMPARPLRPYLHASKSLAPQRTVYYVAPNGKDSNPGTASRPWQTIQKAAGALAAGDTVYIRAGTYHERVVPQHSGSAGNEITFAAYPGESVTIDGSGITLPDDLAGLFHISDKAYIRVSGLRIINARPNGDNAGILVVDSSNIALENNATYNTISSGIGVWGSHHVAINGNRIEQAGDGGLQECISVAGTDTFQVYNNEVLNCHKEGICLKDGSSNGQVYRNHVHHIQRVGIYVDAWDKHTHDIDVFQNIVREVSDGTGIALASETGGLLEDIHIYNNIAYHNRYIGFSISANGVAGPMDDIAILNNTAYDNGWTVWGGGIAVDNPNAKNVVVRNNIVSQNLYFQISVAPGVPEKNYTIDHNLIDGYRGHGDEGETRGDDHVEGDPRFFNAAGAVFYLQADSPGIDTGSDQGAPGADFDGRPRPLDGNGDGSAVHDLGAYEMPLFSARLYLPLILQGH